jgi:hypothetical protein
MILTPPNIYTGNDLEAPRLFKYLNYQSVYDFSFSALVARVVV